MWRRIIVYTVPHFRKTVNPSPPETNIPTKITVDCLTLKMETLRSFEVSVTRRLTTQCYIPEDSNNQESRLNFSFDLLRYVANTKTNCASLWQNARRFPIQKNYSKIFLTKLNKKCGLCLSVWITSKHIKNWGFTTGSNCIEYFIVIFIYFNHIYLIYIYIFIYSTFHSACHRPIVSKSRMTE